MRGLVLHLDCLRELERDRQRFAQRAHPGAVILGLALASLGLFASYVLETLVLWRLP